MTILTVVFTNQFQHLSNVFSITNYSKTLDFEISDEDIVFKQKYNLKPIDECWIVTLDANFNFEELKQIAEDFGIKVKIFKCKNVKDIITQENIETIKSFIFKVTLNAKEKSDILYLSSEKNVLLGAMQESADVFGCDAFYFLNGKNSNPLMLKNKTESSILISSDGDKLKAENYPIYTKENDSNFEIFTFSENKELLNEIEIRKNQSIHLYSNFYGMVKSPRTERDVFRKLYYLSDEKIKKLKQYKLGKSTAKDLWIIKHFPKAELHSHIGGLLSPSEIIEVAQKAKNYVSDSNNENSVKFEKVIKTILKYQDAPNEFDNLIYGNLLNKNNFKAIGINPYQKLGDFQGSSLLQLRETIEATLDIYAKHLIQENVQYVEIRCSPYKYTKLELTIEDVVETMFKTLNKYSLCFDYRLIYIIGRQANKTEIENAIKDYCRLYDENPEFKAKFVGVDVAGNEGATKPSELRGDFMPLLDKCAKITIHAGETESVDSIWEAVYHLSADRIGHGLKLKDKPELLSRFVDKKIGVEMCPSSNYQIVDFKGEQYPLLDYMKAGLRVTLNTDDCGISRTTLANEFLKAAEMCPDLTLWDCIVLIRNSLCIAFCDDKTKDKLMHSFEDEILKLCNEIF